MNIFKIPVGAALKLWSMLNGKKTVLGSVTLLTWILSYGAPVVWPHSVLVQQLGSLLRELLSYTGAGSDTILVSGSSLTVIGLIHKIQKLLKGESDDGSNDGSGDVGSDSGTN